MSAKTFYATTPIFYLNSSPHVGTAYNVVATDTLVRFMKCDGADAYMLTGSDEHGQKVAQAAAKLGRTPQQHVDEQVKAFQAMSRFMNARFDDYIRTTEERHKQGAKALWNKLLQNGWIYKNTYSGWYAVSDEAYYAEEELVNGKAPTGATVEWMEEESYFFKLSAFQEPLLKWYRENPQCILPESRRNEVIKFVEGGLQDLSVSRTKITWGIPVPNDEKHVMYVWLDALANYITALGYPNESAEKYARYWPANVHVVGKDILRFHAVYWPAFLMGANLPVPKMIFAHGWIISGGQKMSKSLGNVLLPDELVKTYGLDAVRYALLREIPFGQDGEMPQEAWIRRNNSDLANDLGNLIQRVMSFIAKNAGASVPKPDALSDADQQMLTMLPHALNDIRAHMQVLAFHKALERIWQVVSAANRYVDEQAPWTLKKTDPKRMNSVLYVLCQVIAQLGVVLAAFMPDSAAKIRQTVGMSADEALLSTITVEMVKAGTSLSAPTPIFPRYVAEEKEAVAS